MKFTLFRSDVLGKEWNTSYPHETEIQGPEDLAAVAAFDHTCARFRNDHRCKENFDGSDVDAWDVDNSGIDDPDEWMTPERFAEELTDVNFALVPSRHNNKEKDGESARPRFHVFCPHRLIKDKNVCDQLKRGVYQEFPFFDDNCLDSARFLYGSQVKPEEVVWHEGTMDIDEFLERQEALAPSGYRIPQGKRNATMSRFAGRVVKRYGHSDDAKSIFMEEAAKCDPPLSDQELEKIWQSAGKFAKKVASAPDYIPPESYNAGLSEGPAGYLKPDDYTDIGQAKMLARMFGGELRYNPATDFLHYNGVIWEESFPAALGAVEHFLDMQLSDSEKLVFQRRQALLNSGMPKEELSKRKPPMGVSEAQTRMFAEYMDALGYIGYVMKRRDVRYIKSAMEAVKPMLFVQNADLDRDEFLLNTPEATYDLRFGMMGRLDHDPKHLITKVTAVDPSDKGRELWEDSLQKTFCGDQELIDYVQEVIGLAAIGKVYVEALIIAYGEGRNGKSTFFNTISKVLGSYSWSLSADAFVVSTRRNTHWEVTELKGRRFVTAAELEEGMRLSTSMLKQITSTDAIQGEKKFKDPAPFLPSHTIILFTNHLPRVGAMDEGTWRRLIVIPFNAVFEGSGDRKNYADYLFENAGPAVLQWIIEGAERVIEKNFHMERPKVVRDAIASYRHDNDWLSAFLEDSCDVDPSYKESGSNLYQSYRSYSERMGEFTRSGAEFSRVLVSAGFEKKRSKTGVMYFGLRLKGAFEE